MIDRVAGSDFGQRCVVDAHHHLWNIEEQPYPWLSDAPPGSVEAVQQGRGRRANIARTRVARMCRLRAKPGFRGRDQRQSRFWRRVAPERRRGQARCIDRPQGSVQSPQLGETCGAVFPGLDLMAKGDILQDFDKAAVEGGPRVAGACPQDGRD